MDASLPSLIELWLSTPSESSDRQSRLEQIVTAVLRKRKIAKRRPEQPKAAIYTDITEALAQAVRTALLNASRSVSAAITEPWLLHTLTLAYCEVLTYNRLTQLAIVLQHQPLKSPGWTYAVATLFEAIELSDKLRRPSWAAKATSEEYADIQNEALANAVKDIRKFDPDRAHFIGWINQVYLGKRGIDTYNKEKDTLDRGNLLQIRKIHRSRRVLTQTLKNASTDDFSNYLTAYLVSGKSNLNPSIQDHVFIWSAAFSILGKRVQAGSKLVTDMAQCVLDGLIETINLDTPISGDNTQSLGDITGAISPELPRIQYLMECLETCDGDGCSVLLEKHLRGKPAATLRLIAQQRLQGKKLREIGSLFDVTPQTIRNFYERNIKHATDCLKQCVENKIEIWKLQHPS